MTLTLITAWIVSGVKVVVLGADGENLSTIDHCTVSVAILDVGQSRQKLQQMYGKFFNYRPS